MVTAFAGEINETCNGHVLLHRWAPGRVHQLIARLDGVIAGIDRLGDFRQGEVWAKNVDHLQGTFAYRAATTRGAGSKNAKAQTLLGAEVVGRSQVDPRHLAARV